MIRVNPYKRSSFWPESILAHHLTCCLVHPSCYLYWLISIGFFTTIMYSCVFEWYRNGRLPACSCRSCWCCTEKEEKLGWCGTSLWFGPNPVMFVCVRASVILYLITIYQILVYYSVSISISCLCNSAEKRGLIDADQEDLMILLPPVFSLKNIPENVV